MQTRGGLRRAGLASFTALCIFGSQAAHALLIDDFSTAQAVAALDPTASASNQADGSMLGGERDIEVTRLNGFGVSAGASSGRLVYDHIVSGEGFARYSWDGNDDSATLNATGLGGIDLTELDASNALLLDILMSDLGALLTFVFYTDAGNYSTLDALIPGNIPPDPSYSLMLHFSSFNIAAGTGVDFTNVGAIELIIDGGRNTPLSLGIDNLSTVLAPEPSSLSLLFSGLVAAGCLRGRKRA